jgi:hypothetical protein
MTVAHVLGLPIEETALSLAPAGAAIVTGALVVARVRLAGILARLGRRRRITRRPPAPRRTPRR